MAIYAIWYSAMDRIVLGWFGGTRDTITTKQHPNSALAAIIEFW